MLSTVEVGDEDPQNSVDRERNEAFKKVQEMLAAVQPKNDSPFCITDENDVVEADNAGQKANNKEVLKVVEQTTAASTS